MSAHAPVVSVVIPAYNAAAFLERALASVIAQTLREIEIIVIDDASSDGTMSVVNRFAAADGRVRFLRNERNAGPAASRNRGLADARGKWVALLDADDEWSPGRLVRMLCHGESHDVISDDILIVNERHNTPYRRLNRTYGFLAHHGMKLAKPQRIRLVQFIQADLGELSPLIHRQFLQKHQIEYIDSVRYGEDFNFHFELLAQGARWLQLPVQSYYIYRHGQNMTDDAMKLASGIVAATESLFPHPATAANPLVLAALHRRRLVWHDIMARAMLLAAMKEGDFRACAELVRDDPQCLVAATRSVVRSVKSRVFNTPLSSSL